MSKRRSERGRKKKMGSRDEALDPVGPSRKWIAPEFAVTAKKTTNLSVALAESRWQGAGIDDYKSFEQERIRNVAAPDVGWRRSERGRLG